MEGWFHGHGMFWRTDGMKYEGQFRGGRIWGLGNMVKCSIKNIQLCIKIVLFKLPSKHYKLYPVVIVNLSLFLF